VITDPWRVLFVMRLGRRMIISFVMLRWALNTYARIAVRLAGGQW
jgi:hypothetical protein